MYFTYILESLIKPDEHYIGHTYNLKKRIKTHNNGKVNSPAGLRPWKIKLYIAFETLAQA